MITVIPRSESCLQTSRPIPRFPPLTSAARPFSIVQPPDLQSHGQPYLNNYPPRSSNAASTAASGDVDTVTCSPRSQPSRTTTGCPTFLASPISESVPYSPPTAMTTSAEHTTARFLACPAPVATEYVRYLFCLLRSSSGRIPMAVPPASVAPRAAASITPESPPQTTVAPLSATSLPTSRACSYSSAAAVPEPTTATYRVPVTGWGSGLSVRAG